MLTIRWKGIHGEDVVFQAARVIKGEVAEGFGPKGILGGHPLVEFYDDRGLPAHDHVFYGNVYVMNENGKTVATHELGGWELVERNTPPSKKK